MSDPALICFGEVLWDQLPTGKTPGGAPMNVAFHANQLGLPAGIISRVGDDADGQELLEFLNDKGLRTDLIQVDAAFPTGLVRVGKNNQGLPAYEIVKPAAWDFIQLKPLAFDMLKASEAIVFGSLACRSEKSRKTLLELLEVATLRIFDINLRPPDYKLDLIEKLLLQTDIAKMSDEELRIVSGWYGMEGELRKRIQLLKEKFELETLIVTQGKDGASVLDDSDYCYHPGFHVDVVDTVGSGDSFLAAFISKLLGGNQISDCLEFACAIGALVATKAGATPTITQQDRIEFLQSSPTKKIR